MGRRCLSRPECVVTLNISVLRLFWVDSDSRKSLDDDIIPKNGFIGRLIDRHEPCPLFHTMNLIIFYLLLARHSSFSDGNNEPNIELAHV